MKLFQLYQIEGKYTHIYTYKTNTLAQGIEIDQYGVHFFRGQSSLNIVWFEDKMKKGYVTEISFDEIKERDKREIITGIFENWGE